ncbi:MAG: 50S ribosome-binding GTPase [Sedimentisphaerales bacterium]|nr:50S ribosome-binding GTPase [Sedimentisphaerales bacterium]
MVDLTDTIVAVSSAGGGLRSIVRITGPETLAACQSVFSGAGRAAHGPHNTSEIVSGAVRIDDELNVNALLYLFHAPHSYTGETLAEIHVNASAAVVEALVQRLLAGGLRPAGPGEFTARAYLNGKIDLAQAEAVNEIIGSSNRFQLDAAERLLSGRLSKAVNEIRTALLDCISLIEAGLDFSEEDVEFISAARAVERLSGIRRQLEDLLAGSIRYESLIDLPAIAIAGAPNAGKSSLLNVLLGQERSLVSNERKTTRDVLSGLLRLGIADCRLEIERARADLESPISNPQSQIPNLQSPISNPQSPIDCVLFDCAGLLAAPESILDELAQRAALEALHGSAAVIFCVDVARSDWDEDRAVRALVGSETVIHVATKSDLLAPETLSDKVAALRQTFGAEFLATSSATGAGLDRLRNRIRSALLDYQAPTSKSELAAADAISGGHAMALTLRHRQAVTGATESVAAAAEEIVQGNEEVAVMMLRTACQAIADIEQEHIDEQVLDRIFSRFCIGK